MTLLKASGIFFSLLWLQGCVEGQVNFEGEITCRTADGEALCPKLSHFESQVSVKAFSNLEVYVAYDPAQSRKATWYDSLDLNMQTLPPQKSWLANYGIDLELSKHWSLHAEDSSGTTLIPNASYLAFANTLQDIGWRQTVTRLSFTNTDIFVGDLIVGLGEGERLEADDADLYLGARFKWYWQKALALQLAYSQDQNSLPKDAVWWLEDSREAHKGFRNQRLAASLVLNGQLSGVRGLEASLGWQSTRIDRSDDLRLSTPTVLALDPTEILSQDLASPSSTTREAWLASASYRILAEYIVAFHFGQFKAGLSDAALSVCSMGSRGNCVEAAEKTNTLSVREWTYGLGKIDREGWSFLLESHQERYDRLYQNFHFLKGNDVRQKSMRLVQARINWDW